MLLQSFISLVLTKIEKLKIFRVIKITTEILFYTVQYSCLFIEVIRFSLSLFCVSIPNYKLSSVVVFGHGDLTLE